MHQSSQPRPSADTGQLDPVENRRPALEAAVKTAYRALLKHMEKCRPCREYGVDCPTARSLRSVWKRAAVAANAQGLA
ncbi:hypothetical protein [Streptomyces sp. NPDC095613]|uniref:hypothetical protein n=1 Tax=Streptomyces sp. NPDC095613 TaxID=3155540 RepID=UPI0033233247